MNKCHSVPYKTSKGALGLNVGSRSSSRMHLPQTGTRCAQPAFWGCVNWQHIGIPQSGRFDLMTPQEMTLGMGSCAGSLSPCLGPRGVYIHT